MIILDSTVLVTYLRTRSVAIEAVFAAGNVGVCGATRAELLHGARDDADFHRTTALLDQFVQIATPSESWDHLGRNLYLLRRAGLMVPFPDVLIPTVAILGGHEAWAYDNHFRRRTKPVAIPLAVSPLRPRQAEMPRVFPHNLRSAGAGR